eukprot:jgi/Ulvmu1/3039/UM015_0079.1
MGDKQTLLRQLARAAETFPDYNLRKYVQQRVADLQHSPDAQIGITKLQEMVQVWERQAAVYQQYARPQKGVMELRDKGALKDE